MKRLIALLVVLGVALVPSTASAHSRAKVYKGTFTLVGADGDYVTGGFGKVQLVDNRRNDKLSVHVRRLAAKTTYTYKLQEGTCKAGAPAGTDVAGFKYKPLRTNRKGVGNSTARSRTFSAKRGTKYEVVVYASGKVALCAQLRTNWWHGKPKPKAGMPKPTGGEPKPKAGKPKPKGDHKPRGKRDDAPGRNQHKPRGQRGH